MEIIHSQLLELLRSGLWDTNLENSLNKTPLDWNAIYTLSKQQAVLGFVLDGINKLPKELVPPRPLYLKWCAEVLEIEDENKRLDKEVVNIFNLLEENNIDVLLMKGQGIARNYPNPYHRSSGDIDIFVGKSGFEQSNSILVKDGKASELWNSKHIAFEWHGVTIENHRIMGEMISPFANKKFQKQIELLSKAKILNYVEIDENKIAVPPVDFNVVFILQHIINHLVSEGIGLRQVCDWMMLLNKKKKDINRTIVIKMLQELGLKKAAVIFGGLCFKFLGLSKEDLILPYNTKYDKFIDILFNEIWYGGNFGNYGDKSKKRPENWFSKRLFNFFSSIKRSKTLYRIAPQEVIWLPFSYFNKFISISYHNFKSRFNKSRT